MFNFIVVVLAALVAVWQGCRNDLVACLVDIGVALINLPFAIKWLISVLK